MAVRGGRVQPFKACKNCGTLAPRNASSCPECGSPEFTDNWNGVLIIVDPEASQLAKTLKLDKPVFKAIIVLKKPVV